jgi:hypothetical protein
MCKWQMEDPEARVKSSLSDCTWLEDLSMDFLSRHLRTYEAKRFEQHLYYIFYFHFISFSFFSLSFSLFLFLFYSSYFSYFSFLLIIFLFLFFIFSFAPQNFLQHNTYIEFVSENDSSPCLNDAHPRA